MAGNRFKGVTGQISTGTSAKTLLQIVAASNHKVLIDEISISFNGTSNTAEPIKVDVLRQTTAGTMSSLTLVKDPDDWDETIQTTAQHTATAEPTASDVLMSEHVHPQQGYTWQAPFSRSIAIGGGDRIGVRVTAPASVSAIVRVAGEE
jgi:hypothetical protein